MGAWRKINPVRQRLGETCRPPQTPRLYLKQGGWKRPLNNDGGFGGNGTFPPIFYLPENDIVLKPE